MKQPVYLMGIGGIGMANFTVLLKQAGFEVSGSDANIYEPAASILMESGIPVLTPYSADNLPGTGIIVVGNALSRGHIEVEAALDRASVLYSFPEFLHRFMLEGRHSMVVAGTHGKSTTTACLAHLLTQTGNDPGFLIGAMPQNFATGAAIGSGVPFVIEGDEYDTAFFDKRSKFLHYFPRTLLLGTVEYDHADIFSSPEEMLLSFRRLINLLPQSGCLIYSADCKQTKLLAKLARCRTVSVGASESADWRLFPDTSELAFRSPDGQQNRCAMSVLGHHNRMNALMALAAAHSLDENLEGYKKALSSFRGLRRRLELLLDTDKLTVYDDFAHHPTAIASALQAVRERHPDAHIIAVCEPRSNTMVRNIFQEELGRAFGVANEVVFGQIHRIERIPEIDRLELPQLLSDIGRAGVAASQLANAEIPEYLVRRKERHTKTVVLFMSNGSFDGVQNQFLELIT